jgi:hypothetical protein
VMSGRGGAGCASGSGTADCLPIEVSCGTPVPLPAGNGTAVSGAPGTETIGTLPPTPAGSEAPCCMPGRGPTALRRGTAASGRSVTGAGRGTLTAGNTFSGTNDRRPVSCWGALPAAEAAGEAAGAGGTGTVTAGRGGSGAGGSSTSPAPAVPPA